MSAMFHSNIAHFFLNLFGIQIYGYVVEWYYGKIRYAITLLFSVLFSHFFSSAVAMTSVSTTSSAMLFTMIGLKIYIMWEFRDYKKLDNRRVFIYLLMGLIVGINLIPIFVVNNVDYASHIGIDLFILSWVAIRIMFWNFILFGKISLRTHSLQDSRKVYHHHISLLSSCFNRCSCVLN